MVIQQKAGIFSFFSGSGFLDLGFESSDTFKILFINEVYPPFIEAYKFSRQKLGLKEPIFGYDTSDVRDINIGNKLKILNKYIKKARETFGIVGFIGGPPCPDFSIGGKNKGKEGENGKLSGCYINLICQTLPDFFVFENVKGLWKTKRHRQFYDILKIQLINSGYCLTERLINALEYGVPQDRERIILIGFNISFLQNSTINYKDKYEINQYFPWLKYIKYSLNDIYLKPWPSIDDFQENSILDIPRGIEKELTVEFWFEKNKVYEHPNSTHYFKPRAGINRFKTVAEGDSSRKSFKRLHRWRYSPTAAYGNNEVHLHPYKIRRISVSEALAIQSLPKEFILPPTMSLSDMFKTIGNGVPFLASVGLANTVEDFIFSNF
ncbi:DNA cytosine methyltransferase [Nostoc punctiforme FACHB-252]|uniref:DNA (cytosine-5-)-methyltransferase n=1 Tax=Nostoc punctiforme FACHB-252 TaxID=1357509 RepID=A0ABR8HK79_NOSPU|nr:DNA cytosine methyltransferase [Nostoc punctiforme]MBD2616224.1 DNA cytosine methyltransferase [Nostoc punctiforme FACHB-252]